MHTSFCGYPMDVFNEYMPNANQIDNLREDLSIDTNLLLEPAKGTITEAGIRKNINVGRASDSRDAAGARGTAQ